VPIVDLHSHVLPGVDDGAQDLEEALEGLRALAAEGVERVVATPHFRGSLLERPQRAAARLARFDTAYAALTEAAAGRGLEIEIERGCEFKLDAPELDLSDPRLRLAGTRFALVEFASFQLPPFGGNQLRAVIDAGWVPVLAHPERYFGVEQSLDQVSEWVEAGVHLQVNTRSLGGGYGPSARRVAEELLATGRVCCVAGDYHCRGEAGWVDAVGTLEGASPAAGSGSDLATGPWIRELLYANPGRLLADDPPSPVPSIAIGGGEGRGRRRRWF